MITVLGWVLAAAVVVNVAVFVLLLASSRRRVRGGNIDLTPAAARGELDLDWSDPRWVDDEGLTPIETHSLLGREA